jgi:xanthine dehydrogenase accessory factor
MGIRLKQGMVITTIIGQENLPTGIVGRKAVFGSQEQVSDNLPSWIREQLQQLADRSLARGEFQISSLSNPVQPQQKVTAMVDPCLPPHELVILGGGHIAFPLAGLGKLLGYKVTVVDDREEFVSAERFPQVDKRIYCSFDDLEKHISPGSRSSVVIVTRGHQHDWKCLQQMLKYPLFYLGVIGSRTKVGILKEKMAAAGYSEKTDSIYMPIGLNIGAQTPEEIAVSIAAELINVRRGGKGVSINSGSHKEIQPLVSEMSTKADLDVIEKAVELACKQEPAVLATIIASEGSTPRKAGSRMLILKDGTFYGTIGGGSGEAEIVDVAKKVLDADLTGLPLLTYTVTMNADTAAQEGMVCGGSMDVFMESVDELARLFGGSDVE